MNKYCTQFTAAELLTATGGKFINSAFPGALQLATDSRKDCADSCFIALKGELFDAHETLDKAIAHGAACLCIEESSQARVPGDCQLPILVVPDTMKAYHAIARFHRLRFPALQLAALTGSVGKTSVKEMIKAICLSQCDAPEQVLATEGNTNNHFGVAANLLRLTPRHKYAVIELGTSGPDEIAPLSQMAMPQVAAINTIAACHLERLHTLAGVAHEKSAIFRYLAPNGTAVFPQKCAEVEIIAAHAKPFTTLRFGENGDVSSTYLGGNLYGSRVRLNFAKRHQTVEFDWALSGAHQAMNAACAAAVGLALGFTPTQIADGLQHTTLPGMRMNVVKRGQTNWIMDAYNANPASMQSALIWLSEFADPHHLLLVLGDMLELGGQELAEHAAILDSLRINFPTVPAILVGSRFQAAAGQLPAFANWHLTPNSIMAAEFAAKLVKPGYTVLVKGSRGIKLESVLPNEE